MLLNHKRNNFKLGGVLKIGGCRRFFRLRFLRFNRKTAWPPLAPRIYNHFLRQSALLPFQRFPISIFRQLFDQLELVFPPRPVQW